jgi:hypothetical protein
MTFAVSVFINVNSGSVHRHIARRARLVRAAKSYPPNPHAARRSGADAFRLSVERKRTSERQLSEHTLKLLAF